MKSAVVAVLAFISSTAFGAQTLNTLDLSKDFKDTTINIATDQTYANGAIVLVPAPTTPDDQYMVSIQQNMNAQCTVSGVMAKKADSAQASYFVVVHVLAMPAGDG